jgi:hypothetical protein
MGGQRLRSAVAWSDGRGLRMSMERRVGRSEKAVARWRWLLAGLSVLMVVLFLVTTVFMLRFRYDMNDTNMLATVWRFTSGQQIYVTPTAQFVPFLYTPLYYYVSAALAHFFGTNYFTLRLVSTLATLGCFAMIYRFVMAEVNDRLAALAAVGCFAACYPAVLQFFSTARVDMLFLFFVVCALYATRRMNPIIAALLWVCAFQTKQGVLPIAVLAMCHDWQRPRRTWAALATFALGLMASIAWLTHASGGWYRYYVFGMAGGFGFNRHIGFRYLTVDLLGVYGIALLVIFAALLLAPIDWRSRGAQFCVFSSVGMIGFTGYLRAHRGAGANSLLPAFLWISILFGFALAELFKVFAGYTAQPRRVAMTLLLAASCVQLAVHVYSPFELAPRARQAAWRQAFVDQIRQIPGDVLVFAHPETAALAGKPWHAQLDAAGSVIEASDRPNGDRLMAEYAALIHQRAFSAVVLDTDADTYSHATSDRVWMPQDFNAYYPLRIAAAGEHPEDDLLHGQQPVWIYLPCTSIEAAKQLDPAVYTAACKNGKQ